MDDKNAFVEDVITLRGEEIQVRSGYVPHQELRFYSENPRIYSQVWQDHDEEPSQEVIFRHLSRMEHVRDVLIPSIRHNGGLIEPVLVRQGVVLEGNSRLAAYRLLFGEDKERWKLIRVRLLPNSITESQVFSLLGEFHIVGKKDWAPYEQAGYLWRRFNKHQMTEDELKAECGLGKARIRHLVHVYGFMLQHGELDPARWSYYDELFTGRKFSEARELYPTFDQVIAEKVKSGEIKRAVDLRDDLPLIVRAGNKVLKKFVDGRLDFEEAIDDAKARGAGNVTKKRLEDFRRWFGEDEREEDVAGATGEEGKALKFLLQKIRDRADGLLRKHFKAKE